MNPKKTPKVGRTPWSATDAPVGVRRSCDSSAASKTRTVTSEKIKNSRLDPDEIFSEYDFSRGRPNKYASRALRGIIVKNRPRRRVHP